MQNIPSFLSLNFNDAPSFFLVSSIATMKVTAAERKGTCLKLREQLEALEKESSMRLAEIERYNKDMQVFINAPDFFFCN